MNQGEIVRSEASFAIGTCGHSGPPRRVCDVCKTARYAFTACSNQCLRIHQTVAHDPVLPADAATRARRAQAQRNSRGADVWNLFADHRERLMTLIPPETTGGTICVLGAGKCDDLDLPRLARQFAEIHLVDLDGEAMQRARDRQPRAVRDAIVLHGAVDLSGLLERLDEWGEAFPDDDALHEAVYSAALRVADAIGGAFDVTLSTCVLSQLMVPFQTAWAASQSTWSKLEAAVTAVHVGVLARIRAPRGAASLVFDVLSSNEAPGLTALQGRSPPGAEGHRGYFGEIGHARAAPRSSRPAAPDRQFRRRRLGARRESDNPLAVEHRHGIAPRLRAQLPQAVSRKPTSAREC